VHDPTTVYVLDHGRHTSLVLPDERGLVRYAYGDWRWYALGDTGIHQGLAALFTRSPAGLGRRLLPGDTPDEAFARLQVGVEARLSIRVEASAATALRDQLDHLHAVAAVRVENASADLEFALHPEPYSLLNNSNTMVTAWLEALGCRVVPLALLHSVPLRLNISVGSTATRRAKEPVPGRPAAKPPPPLADRVDSYVLPT
jgi:hypothetical protein